MRTSQKDGKRLLQEASEAMSCKPQEVYQRITKIQDAFMSVFKEFGFGAVQISHYKDARWEISALAPKRPGDQPGGVKWLCMPFEFKELVTNTEGVVSEFCDLCSRE